METNNQDQQPVPQPQQEAQPEITTKSNLPMIIVVVLIVAALLLGGYIVMSGQGGKQDQYSSTPTRAPTASSDLEEDLDALEVESNDSDFEDVDKDLQSL